MHKTGFQGTPIDLDSVRVSAPATSTTGSASPHCTPEGRTGVHEAHRLGSWLRDIILGGQDGLVNVLGIVLGATAAGAETRILIAATAGGDANAKNG
jgi:hypothetical protein